MTRTLKVWWDHRIVGDLIQDDRGELKFAYGAEWLSDEALPALSASLPKRAQPFHRRACEPFFGGLLPEASQRDAIAQALGITATNTYGMLEHQGGDVAGALQFLPPGEPPADPRGPWEPIGLSDEEVVALLDKLPVRPLLAGEDGLRLSLAGAQSKVPVVLVKGRVAKPCPGQPPPRALKPPFAHDPATTENEAFAMALAQAISLDVAKAVPTVIHPPSGPSQTYLLIERYDRAQDPLLGIRRIHQEDFCQALGVRADLKYERESSVSPTLPKCFDLLRRVAARPAQDVLKLLDATIFNAILGNADAHGKNFSILYARDGARLAPLYDLLSTVAYAELSPNFAMKIAGRSTIEELTAADWTAFARRVGLGAPFVRKRVASLADAMRVATEDIVHGLLGRGLEDDALIALSTSVKNRTRLVRV